MSGLGILLKVGITLATLCQPPLAVQMAAALRRRLLSYQNPARAHAAADAIQEGLQSKGPAR